MEGWGRGQTQVPLGTFSPSLSFLLNSIHPLKITTYEVAKCFLCVCVCVGVFLLFFLGVMAVAEISRKCLRLTAKIKVPH